MPFNHAMKTISQPASLSNRILFGLLLGVLAYFSVEAGAGASLETRVTMLGYCVLFASALFATSLPNALIPDSLLSFHQLVNTSPRALFAAQFRRWLPWIGSMLVPPAIIAFYDPGAYAESLGSKFLMALGSMIAIAAIGMYSFAFYYGIGPVAQRWQEGTAGQWYDRLKEYSSHPVPLPRGLIPALTATSRVFSLGIVVAIVQLYLTRDAVTIHLLWPALALFLWAVVRLQRLQASFDRAYYHTNAFYREIFQRGSLRTSEREPISYEAVYWVPARWRSHAWVNLVQLDRVMPIGRFFAIGLFVLAILIWQRIDPVYITTYLLLFIAAKNLASLTLSRADINPPVLQRLFQSRLDWSLTRFFINVRWTLPLLIGLLALGWLHPGFSMQAAGIWTLADLALSFIFAWITTFSIATQSRERVHG